MLFSFIYLHFMLLQLSLSHELQHYDRVKNGFPMDERVKPLASNLHFPFLMLGFCGVMNEDEPIKGRGAPLFCLTL